MQWQDEAIIIGVKRHGETSVIAEVMTRGRGRHLGIVRSGRSRTMQPVLQPGNRVEVVWRARLDEHLGEFKLEPVKLRAARLMETATSLYGVQAMGALLRLLPERDPHPHLYEALDVILETMVMVLILPNAPPPASGTIFSMSRRRAGARSAVRRARPTPIVCWHCRPS